MSPGAAVKRGTVALFDADRRLSYRRTLAFLIGTIFRITEHIDQWAWLALACIYIGSEAAQRIYEAAAGRPAAPPAPPPEVPCPPSSPASPGASP